MIYFCYTLNTKKLLLLINVWAQLNLLKFLKKLLKQNLKRVISIRQGFSLESIYSLEYDQLYQAINQLALDDKRTQTKDYEKQLKDQNNKLFADIQSKLNQLFQIQNSCKYSISEIIQLIIQFLKFQNKIQKQGIQFLSQSQNDKLKKLNDSEKFNLDFTLQSEDFKELYESKLYLDMMRQYQMETKLILQNLVNKLLRYYRQQYQFKYFYYDYNQSQKQNPKVLKFKILNSFLLNFGLYLKKEEESSDKKEIQQESEESIIRKITTTDKFIGFEEYLNQLGKDSKQNFKFYVNDVIRMEVNSQDKVIIWLNESQNMRLIQKIEIRDDQQIVFFFRMVEEDQIQIFQL